MKRFRLCLTCLKKNLAKIHLVDKCLIVFMAVLLAQSAYNLFSSRPMSNELANIDVIVRTSGAAVFGYFLSANFIRHGAQEKNAPQNEPPPAQRNIASRLQILIATYIGLFCLLVLLMVRDIPGVSARMATSPSAIATVAQMRDFVSGCVGFLIGCPTSPEKRE